MKLIVLFSDTQLADLARQTRKEIARHDADLLLLKSKIVRNQCIASLRAAREKLQEIEGEQKARMMLAAMAS